MIQRIAILSVHTSPLATPGGKKVGGMNTYIREIAQTFATMGIQVDIFTRRVVADSPSIDASLGSGVNVIQITAGGLGDVAPDDLFPHLQAFTAGVIAYSIRNNVQYDLIFSHYWLSGWVAQKLKEFWGTPFVHMFHTLGRMKNRIPSMGAGTPHTRIHVETQIVQWANVVLANTPAERTQLIWLYHADRRKVFVCPPGVNLTRFHPIEQHVARHALNLPVDERLMVFVGRIEPLKAVDSILYALAALGYDPLSVSTRPKLLIIGGNPQDRFDGDMVNLRQLCTQLGLNEQVEFIPAQAHDRLALYYAAADVVLVPSEYESFGMVALEAMASGTPVIASAVGGLAYLVKDGYTGLLVPVRDSVTLASAIQHILVDDVLRGNMAKASVLEAQKYSWQKIAESLLVAFEAAKSGSTSSELATIGIGGI
jgi:D-inositol-3-phosphate glycosyltransferase